MPTRTPRIIVYPYKMGSRSARQLSDSLVARRVRPVSPYTPRRRDFIVNWGASTTPSWNASLMPILSLVGGGGATILNKPENVALASNKLRTFRRLQERGVSIPEFNDSRAFASNWTSKVYARHKLTGHSGDGIEVIQEGEDMLPVAPLYVKGIENHGEYRVHVLNGQVIDYTKKRRRSGEDQDDDVRNLANGWIYARTNLRRLERVENLAIEAVQALELDFGAVDIIMNEDGEVFVLEVNTACGMSDTTLNSYVNAFRNLISIHHA